MGHILFPLVEYEADYRAKALLLRLGSDLPALYHGPGPHA